MPSIETNRQAGKLARDQGRLVPIESTETKPPIPVADYPGSPLPYLRTPLPTTYVQQPDQQRVWQTGATPQSRIPPTSATSNPVVGAQAASQTILISQGTTSGLLLETNNKKNNSQSVLNLLPGTGITLSADAQGGVTINGTGGGTSDGLIHGDTIWESDTAYTLLRDEFSRIGSTSQAIGELGWTLAASSAGTATDQQGSSYGFPASGGFSMSTNGTANGYQNINLMPSAQDSPIMPLYDYPGWKATFVFDLTVGSTYGQGSYFLQKSLYVGLGFSTAHNNWPARPLVFAGLRYDTDTTAPSIADTTFVFEVVSNFSSSATHRNNTQGTTFNTGVAPAMGQYRLEIECLTAGVITMSLNGSTPHTFSIPTITSGTGVDAGTAIQADGVGSFSPSTAASTLYSGGVFAAGSKVLLASVGAPFAYFDGVQTLIACNPGSSPGTMAFLATHVNIGASSVVGTATGFPGVTPIFAFGNDTQATPVSSSTALMADFFSLIWNPGVGGGSGTPNPLRPRYFN